MQLRLSWNQTDTLGRGGGGARHAITAGITAVSEEELEREVVVYV